MEDRPAGLSKGRLVTGVVIFIAGQATTLLIPLVSVSNLPTSLKSLISGLLFFVTPQIGIVLAVAILGRAGYNYLKSIVFRWFKKYGPPEAVSLTRYRIGLVMFCVPVLFGWLEPYFGNIIPVLGANRLLFCVTGDVIFIVSFFVLGGEFWDKVRALFIHGARVKFPD
ncbi:MAG: hypothetical protein WBD00_03110 [Candidatus Omnitrophota bacterium]